MSHSANRAFGRRVTGYAASGCGIRQFIDIGAGLPAPDATHEIARRVSPGCRVVYADNDPFIVQRARGRLVPGSGCVPDYIRADVRDPGALLAKAGPVLDLARPVAVLLLGILHFIPDEDDPAGIVAELAATLAPGSLFAISHLTADHAPDPVADSAADACNALVPASLRPRSKAEVASLFGGLPLKWPGVVPVTRWRPSFHEAPGGPCDMYGGVAAWPPARTIVTGSLPELRDEHTAPAVPRAMTRRWSCPS